MTILMLMMTLYDDDDDNDDDDYDDNDNYQTAVCRELEADAGAESSDSGFPILAIFLALC